MSPNDQRSSIAASPQPRQQLPRPTAHRRASALLRRFQQGEHSTAQLLVGQRELRQRIERESPLPLSTATWLADVATVPAFRRRGIARALLAHILAEDARLDAHHSVLLATQSGALLYPHLGYEQRGLLQIYAPPRGA